VLRCTGDEDRTTQWRRRGQLARAIRAHDDVTVDLSDLGFADASLMLDFAMVARRLRQRGGALLLRYPQPHIQTLIELVGLLRIEGVRLIGPASAAA
jgi:anti-anti-sigma regulatory factor